MKSIIKSTIVNGIIILITFVLTSSNLAAQKRNPLWDTQNEFRKEGYGLRGPVYSVTVKRMYPVIELGMLVRTDSELLDSLVFDEKGNIAKRYSKSGEQIYQLSDSTVVITLSEDGYGRGKKSAEYTHNSSGRICEVRYFEDGKLTSRRVFEYTPTGFKSVYYYDRDNKIVYGKKGNEFVRIKDSGFITEGTLNKNGQPVKITEDLRLYGKSTTYYTYNQSGDLIKEQNKADIGNKMVGTRRKEKVYRYEYVYDDHGNWIEKRTYENGELKREYESRQIVYKSPEEIFAVKKAEQEQNQLFEQELQSKGVAFADTFINEKKGRFAERLIERAFLDHDSDSITNFSVKDDVYSFVFSDGDTVSNVRFIIPQGYRERNRYERIERLISSDLHIVLCADYTSQGPKWYVAKYGKDADFDFNPNDSTDWVKVYRNRFPTINDISENEIHEVWQYELNRQWEKSDYSSKEYAFDPKPICVNKLEKPYEKGFVSPSIANKRMEAKSLNDYRNYQEEEQRRKEEVQRREEERQRELEEAKANRHRIELCCIAQNACRFNEKGKPDTDKLKKFNIDESGYYFKTKDNSEIKDVTFYTFMGSGNGGVYLSTDCSVAIVKQFTYTDVYIFVVELDGDQVKSVNYISPKDATKFTFPSASVSHRY